MRTYSVVFASVTAVALGVSGLVACSSSAESTSGSNQAVTNVTETPVTDQGQTGNCWLYATTGWVEALHANANNGSSVHYSPAYLFYWDLYEQLVAGTTEAEYGGYWGSAGDLILQYGLLPMGAFDIDDVATQEAAIDAVNKGLQSGAIATNDGGTRDPVAVRAALDEAFKLGNDQRALLTQVFGADGTHTFDKGATPAGGIVSAQTFSVQTVLGQGQTYVTTLDQLFGADASPDGDPDERSGQLAWTAAYPPDVAGFINFGKPGNAHGMRPGRHAAVRPSGYRPRTTTAATDSGTADAGVTYVNGLTNGGPLPAIPKVNLKTWRTFLQRIQRALNDGVPVPMGWMADDDDINKYGAFTAGGTIMPWSVAGGHEVLLSDYQVSNVPGYGTLKAGITATPAQLEASLAEGATVDFFRVKNSWGTDIWKKAPVAGYNDVYMGYLSDPTYYCDDIDGPDQNGDTWCYPTAPQLQDVVLPAGY